MLTRRQLAGLVAAASAASAAPVMAASATRRAEADALRRFALAKHPRGLEAASDAAWLKSWRDIADTADKLNDGAYVVALRRALSWFKDGHTTVLPFEFTGGVPDAMSAGPFGLKLPVRARTFDDGLWIVRAKDEALPLLGAKVLRVAGVPVEKAVAALIDSWAGENPAWGHNWAWLLLSSLGLLRGLGLVTSNGDVTVDAVDAAGKPLSAVLRPRADASENLTDLTRNVSPPEAFAKAFGRTNFVALPRADGALYVSIDDMSDVDGYAFETLTKDVLAAIAKPAVSRVVIDLRRNGGGDNYFGEPLRRELARSRLNRPGGIYVLTAPQTFSAAQNLANRLERETFATFVGEPTGSAPNMHGDPELFTGPASGVVAMVSTLRWYDGGPNDARRWIFPDLFVPNRFADWAAGTDRALDAALADTPSTADDFRTRTRYFERSSQAQDWRPFWRNAPA